MSKFFPTLFIGIALPAQAQPEDWYSFWGLGLAQNNYSGDRKNEVDRLKASNLDMTESKANVLGFYWPYSEQEALGFVLNGVATRFMPSRNKCNSFKEVSYTDSTISMSYMKFYGSEIGHGWYYRGDLGVNTSETSFKTHNCSDINQYEQVRDDDFGAALLLGGGYGFKYSEETRILVGMELSQTFIDNNEVTSLALTVNGLW